MGSISSRTFPPLSNPPRLMLTLSVAGRGQEPKGRWMTGLSGDSKSDGGEGINLNPGPPVPEVSSVIKEEEDDDICRE